jgi:rod shape-determining protein MreB
MIINIGGGTSEIAVISLGGIVSATSARVGGNKIDQAIIDYIKRKYSLAIGDRTAEEVKIKIGSAISQVKETYLDVRGRDLTGGLPKTVKISSNEVAEAIQDELREMINAIKRVLRDTPPELSSDIIANGIVINGGGALFDGVDEFFQKRIGLDFYISKNPLVAVVEGTKLLLKNRGSYFIRPIE